MILRMILKKYFGLIVVGKKEEFWEVFLNMFVVWFKLEFLMVIKLVELFLGSKMLFLFDGIF